MPSGTRRVGPDPTGACQKPPSGISGRVGGAGTLTRLPSGSTATWSTSDCGTVEAVNTPYGLASAGGAVTWKPGYDASASSIGTRENARPTVSLSWSCTDRCSSALAASSESALAWSVRASVHSRRSGRRPASACSTCARTSAAFAGTSSPVSTNVVALRKPASRTVPTLRSGGGGAPTTPDTRTRSGPTWSRWIVSNRDTTSGPTYSARSIS